MIKPATEIRNLKKELAELREVCHIAGIPWLIVYFPKIVLKEKRDPITREQVKWVKEKTKEFENLFLK